MKNICTNLTINYSSKNLQKLCYTLVLYVLYFLQIVSVQFPYYIRVFRRSINKWIYILGSYCSFIFSVFFFREVISKFYCIVCKNHKNNSPLRPVLAAINTRKYYIWKWLENKQKPYLKSNWIISFNIEFIGKLNKIKLNKTDKRFTFNIKWLHNNGSLEETIEKVT